MAASWTGDGFLFAATIAALYQRRLPALCRPARFACLVIVATRSITQTTQGKVSRRPAASAFSVQPARSVTSTIDLLLRQPDRYKVEAITGQRNVEALAKAAHRAQREVCRRG